MADQQSPDEPKYTFTVTRSQAEILFHALGLELRNIFSADSQISVEDQIRRAEPVFELTQMLQRTQPYTETRQQRPH